MGFRLKIAVACVAISVSAYGQKLDLSSLESLAAKAKKTEDVTLDAERLKLAGAFLTGRDVEQKAALQLLDRVSGVYVRTFEFDAPVPLDLPELAAVRKQLSAAGWAKIVDVKDRGSHEDTQVYIFSTKDSGMGGLAVVSLDKNELTVVNIAGAIGLEDLRKLGGTMGIPGVDSLGKPKPEPKPAPKKDE